MWLTEKQGDAEIMFILMNITIEENMACYSYCPINCMSSKYLKKKRQEAPNGVVYAKSHIPKPRFNLITVSAIPETES